MTRRSLFVVSALVLSTLWAGVQQATAQPGGGGCQLAGTANFSKPGLTNTSANFTYSFTGSLSNCQSNESGAPTAGTVAAGQILAIKGEKFQEPIPTGKGSCGNGATAGLAFIKWSNGSYTIINYTTNSAGAAVVLQGSVVASAKLKAFSPKPGQPKSTTLKTTTYSGAGALGLLTFQPPDPTACSGSGVTSAAINGFTGIGSQS
jgi:hypothetical protein